jgi:hypothetical protein
MRSPVIVLLLVLGQEAAEKVSIRPSAPKGAVDFEGFAASLKRCPDTKPEFFRTLPGGRIWGRVRAGVAFLGASPFLSCASPIPFLCFAYPWTTI